MDATQLPVLSVTELNTLVNEALGRIYVWVKGEVSGYKVSQNKWVTFDLKDEGSKINCFMSKYQLDQVLEDGMEVKVLGVPRVYVPYGKYSFTVQRVEPVGEGALRRAFELTKAKLEAEGLFAPERKKPIPRFPRTIGLVTSLEAAAYTDFLRILENRWRGVTVYVKPALVQGNDAPEAIAAALNWFNRHQPVDVLVLTRGGGSLEDLMAFNSETVCRAVFGSRIPVICGIGHERDTCLAEMVADVRASTPSNAAERAVPDRAEVLWQLGHMQKSMHDQVGKAVSQITFGLHDRLGRMERAVASRLTAFATLANRLTNAFGVQQQKLVGARHRLDDNVHRLQQSFRYLLAQQHDRLAQVSKLFESFNPRKVLQRGYAIPRLANGDIIRKLTQVKVGQIIQTELTDGVFTAQVQEKGKRLSINDRLL